MVRQLLVAYHRVLFGKQRFGRHTTREQTTVEQRRTRRSNQLTVQTIDVDVLVHVVAQVMQVDCQTRSLRTGQGLVPIIEVAQIRLHVLRTHLQVMPLMLLLVGVHIADGHEEDIDEHRHHRDHHNIHNTRAQAHITRAAIVNQDDDADQDDQSKQHMAEDKVRP